MPKKTYSKPEQKAARPPRRLLYRLKPLKLIVVFLS